MTGGEMTGWSSDTWCKGAPQTRLGQKPIIVVETEGQLEHPKIILEGSELESYKKTIHFTLLIFL